MTVGPCARIMAAVLAAALLFVPAAAHAEARVVSVGGSLTEIVFALGLGERLVAVDSTSLYPPAALEKPNVGYMRQLAAEPILSLEPTLVLAEADAGPPAALEQLRDAGVAVVTIPDEFSPQGVLDKIGRVATVLGAPERGEALAARVRDELRDIAGRLENAGPRPRVLFLLSVGTGTPMAAGRNTSAAGIIALAGGENAIEGFEGYKPLSPEAAVAANPDVVLVTTRTLQSLGGRAGLLARPELTHTAAGQSGRVVAIDGLLLLGFGPRTGAAIRTLAAALHPGLGLRTE